eukprot:gb/GECG01003521.1/.p1 GENE.gb/GECG01003521.1/~~gb/GECG01003521.1/.p1  ORF type:complete len:545 (+),score=30.57 gb/GECG01003521.1/:1-1635(+)
MSHVTSTCEETQEGYSYAISTPSSASDRVKWKALASAFLMEATAGTGYAFGLYSDELKNHLHFDQSQIEFIGTAGNIGLWTAVEGGVIYDSNGPFITIVLGMCFNTVGYLMLYGGSTQVSSVLSSPAMMAIAMAIGSHGSAYISTTAVSTNVKNFGPDKGKALGLLKAFLGLSASLLASVYTLVFQPHVNNFLLFQALVIPILLLISLFIGHKVSPLKHSADSISSAITKRRLGWGYVLVIGLGVYVLTTSVLLQLHVLARKWEWLLGSIALIVALTTFIGRSGAASDTVTTKGFTPLVDATRGGNMPEEENSRSRNVSLSHLFPVPLGEISETVHEGSVSFTFCQKLKKKFSDMGMFLKDWKFYALFLALFSILGSGITVINNVGSLVKALDPRSDNVSTYVVAVSIGNCFGRITTGFISDGLSRKCSRSFIIAVDSFLMSVAMLLFALTTTTTFLYFPCLLTGFAYGGMWPLWLALISDIWGESNFGSLVTLLALAPASASLLLSQQVSQTAPKHISLPNGSVRALLFLTAELPCLPDAYRK